jgi:tetratricopeptide (TPR) repeat protein
VETIRSLIDRDVVQPSGGVYRLVGDVGKLTVPRSLRALLAARLDALDAGVRRLVTDAAVLGTTFSAEALIAVSDLQEPAVRSGLADLVRQDVLAISADPLSPERGSYRFAQHMLREVAYDTLSRRDRKTRHLAVAAYLRSAYAGDGEEVADVIARHYLDALEAVPGAPDVAEIRSRAVAELIRAAERARRTGAPVQAAVTYAAAADLHVQRMDADGDAGSAPEAGDLWGKAGRAALDGGDYPAAINYAGLARDYHARHGDLRAAAAAQSLLGLGLEMVGRAAEARGELKAALEVLRDEPDVRTVRALQWLANAEAWSGSPDADQLTRDALELGQRLDVEVGILTSLFDLRALYLRRHGQRPEAVAYLRENVRLATAAQDNLALGRALGSLADLELCSDPAAAAEDSRAAIEYLKRAGAAGALAVAIANLGWALLMLGDWDDADAELSKAADSGGLAGFNYVFMVHGLLHALRGETAAAEACVAALDDMRASEDPQDICGVALPEAFIAVARRLPDEALRDARAVLAFADALGMTQDVMQWAWPLAARLASDLGGARAGGARAGDARAGDAGARGAGAGEPGLVSELLGLLDARQPGQLSPLLRAERELVVARLAANAAAGRVEAGEAGAGDVAAREVDVSEAFAAAIRGLRGQGTPFHLAHGLLDHAEYLISAGELEAAAEAVAEATAIARKLRCQPLLDRAAAMPADATSPASVRT